MPPPPNEILFTFLGDPWRLSGVCLVAAGLIFAAGATSMTMLIRRHGRSRLLSRAEAARVAMHAGETSYVDGAVALGGPAVGKEWRYSCSIGDLRKAWHAKNYKKFFGVPATFIALWSGADLAFFALTVHERHWSLFAVASAGLVPMIALMLFSMWAAIYTRLE
ncbi:MAG: hypothetical protein JWN04_1068 [Myxococcaceae bacterium]|nr:hypothetical protein [Myxococcaceae bacterium]